MENTARFFSGDFRMDRFYDLAYREEKPASAPAKTKEDVVREIRENLAKLNGNKE